MKKITEQRARELLAQKQSPAASVTEYAAGREAGGWRFVRAGNLEDVPLGESGWVVADSERADAVRLGETSAEALSRLSA